MAGQARAQGHPGGQEPQSMCNGQVPVLLPGAGVTVSPIAPAERPVPQNPLPGTARFKCPLCGRRNLEAETFECKGCGRDYLCNEHFVKARRCCEGCVSELEAQEVAVREKAEAERQRQEEQRRGQEQAEAERRPIEEEFRRRNPSCAKKERPWENSLGLKVEAGGWLVASGTNAVLRSNCAFLGVSITGWADCRLDSCRIGKGGIVLSSLAVYNVAVYNCIRSDTWVQMPGAWYDELP